LIDFLRSYVLAHEPPDVVAYDVGLLEPWFVSGAVDPCQPNAEPDRE
jgi:hypothetical protein